MLGRSDMIQIIFKIYAYEIVPEEKKTPEKKKPQPIKEAVQETSLPAKKDDKPYVISMKPQTQTQAAKPTVKGGAVTSQVKKKKKDKDDCAIF